MSTLWYKLKYHKYDVIKVVGKSTVGITKKILIILYDKFAYLRTNTSRMTGHLTCKI